MFLVEPFIAKCQTGLGVFLLLFKPHKTCGSAESDFLRLLEVSLTILVYGSTGKVTYFRKIFRLK